MVTVAGPFRVTTATNGGVAAWAAGADRFRATTSKTRRDKEQILLFMVLISARTLAIPVAARILVPRGFKWLAKGMV